MAATLDSFFGKKDDLRVPYGRGKKPDSEKSVDLRSEERLMSKSPLAEENKLKAVKLCTGDGMKNLENPAPLETLAMDPENKSIISGVFVNSKENKDKDRASVKVYTRRVGQEVFWDTKLQRHRPLEELTRDPEIRDELRDYKMFQVLKESEMESEMDLRMMGYSDNLRINADNCWDSMELENPATFEELGMDPENKGIISDFFGFVRANELCKRIGQASKRDNWLVYDSPGTGRSSLIAAMANHLKFDIYHLDLTSFSSLKELEYTLLSTRDHSVIAIEGLCQFAIEGLYRCHKMRLDLRSRLANCLTANRPQVNL